MKSLSSIKEVISHRNVLAIAGTMGTQMFFRQLWNPFFQLYVLDLGASIQALGLLLAFEGTWRMLLQLPGGMLSDRYGRKRVIIVGTALRVMCPIVYFLARSWHHLIPGLIFSAMSSVYMPAFNTTIAESLPPEKRGSGFGAYTMIRSIPSAFAPFIGGVVIDQMGLTKGFRSLVFCTALIAPIILFSRAKFIKETYKIKERKKMQREDRVLTLRKLPRTVIIMLLVSCISYFALQLSFQLIGVYAVNVMGLSTAQWGLIGTVNRLVTTLLSMPGGILSDLIGRKPCILISLATSPITKMGLAFSQSFTHVFIVQLIDGVGQGIGGGTWGVWGGPAWQALIADLVPSRIRGSVLGLIGTVTGLISLPSPWLGGFLWDNFNPKTPLWTSFIIGIIPFLIFTLFIKEPKVKES